MFIGNVPKLQFYITQRFLDINNLKRKDIVITFARMVVKRSWFDSLREGGGPPGFAQIDQNYMDWLEEQVHAGKANAEEVARYKNMSFIERQNHQFKPINRAMLNEIVEGIESGKLNGDNDSEAGPDPTQKKSAAQEKPSGRQVA